MRIRLSVPDSLVGPATIHPALESVVRLNEALLRQGLVPPFSDLVRMNGVRWAPEPSGHGEHFDAADTVVSRGWGDCDDLAPYYAGELRATGVDKGAKVVMRKTGPHRWHALVKRSSGEIEDPSAAAGMPTKSAGINGAFDRPMKQGAPFVDVAPWRDEQGDHGYVARADLPIGDVVSLAHYALARDPRTAAVEAAISGACHGVCHGFDDHAATLGTIASAIAGYGVDSAAEQWGTEVGSIFSSLSKAASGLASLPSKAIETATAVVAPVLKTATGVLQNPMSALQNPMGLATGLASGLTQAVAPALQSVLQSGLPIASQLLPLLVPGAGAMQFGLPLLQAIMAAQGGGMLR